MIKKEIQLTEQEAVYLASVAVPRWVRANNKHVAHIWFELFLEELDKLGYTVIEKPVDKETE